MANLSVARGGVRKRVRKTRTVSNDLFNFAGGLNMIDPPLVVKPGQLIAAENYEIGLQGGYERLAGFEIFDGQESPSDHEYYIVPFRHSREFGEDTNKNLTAGKTYHRSDAQIWGTIMEMVELFPPENARAFRGETLNSVVHRFAAVDLTLANGVRPPLQRDFGISLRGLITSFGGLTNNANFLTAPHHPWAMIEQSGNGEHGHGYFASPNTPLDLNVGDVLLCSTYLKLRNPERRYIKVRFCSSSLGGIATQFPSGDGFAVFDMLEQKVVSFNGNIADAYVEDIDPGNGWMRAVVVSEVADDTTLFLFVGFFLSAESDPDDIVVQEFYAGDPALGCFITGHFSARRNNNGELPILAPYRRNVSGGEPFDSQSGVGYIVSHNLDILMVVGSQGNIFDDQGTKTNIEYSGEAQLRGAPTNALDLQYQSDAADLQRLNIGYPGTDNDAAIGGVWFYNGIVFAIKPQNDPTTYDAIWKSSAAGWVEQVFNDHLDFHNGDPDGPPSEGDTIDGDSSGASATLMRLNVTDDDWAGSNATGVLVLGTVTNGPFLNAELLKISGTTFAQADLGSYVPTLTKGSRYEFATYNFFGNAEKKRMYGVNGVDRYFEYDSVDGVLASYKTGMVVDAPTHLTAHLYMLFLSFDGGSMQNSGVGQPYVWTVVTGAAEIAVGDDITGLLAEVSDALFIFTEDQTYQLNGKTVATFDLNRFDPRTGAKAGTIQRIGMGIHLDDRGFQSLVTSDRFGNYESNSFSRAIQPVVDELLKNGPTTTITSTILRTKNRYRCFFARWNIPVAGEPTTEILESRFISIGLEGQDVTGMMICDYGLPVTAICSEEDTDGTERIFFGTGGTRAAGGGTIYEAEKGTSFNGAPIRAAMRLVEHHSGAPDRIKKYRRARTEAFVEGQASVSVVASYGSNNPDLNAYNAVDITSIDGGMSWDDGHDWDNFSWDKKRDSLRPHRLDGSARSISLTYIHESELEKPHTLRAVNLEIAARRIDRTGQGE